MYGLVMYGLRYAVLSLNTRVRRGRDRHDKGASDARGVSTHASARDATLLRTITPFRWSVSTHASAGDATLLRTITPFRWSVSTHASAGDATQAAAEERGRVTVSTHASARDATLHLCAEVIGYNVSTHASARDATWRRRTVCFSDEVSTHASARDATTKQDEIRVGMEFQLTRPRGTRPAVSASIFPARSFNSRVREGRDWRGVCIKRYYMVSTHASARDATKSRYRSGKRDEVSTHASARDAT